ncbi:DUF1396 domain-containing protein [Streptomyces sp. MUM 136J]|uniref:DUF1396 domain-containing protein n=1 Tax=Streptomyces sp. MUM 136J TaxID=2791992 RepID=UPI001F047C85|nr:DUF1396 domain-containing protein [Streptomyces sp. MUM 136J]MCH0568690.1 DUF1396 domain-containing protein [Streptomyces sp. MUM 136J]
MKPAAPAVAVATLLLAGAVGCSAGDASPEMEPAAAAVARAAKSSDDITSFRYRITGTVPETGRVHGEAAMNVEPLAMSMRMTAEDRADDGQVEIRLVDGAMYIGGGAEAAKETDGKSWIKFDLSATGADGELNSEQLGGGQAGKNPAAESTFLTGSKDVKKVGSETVEGVRTTHYNGTVTLDALEKSFDKADKATREKRQKSIEQYEKMGVDRLTMDLWVDGDDHTKRFRMRGDADKGPLDMTITFFDVNKPVTVAAPPARDVADLAEMMKDGGA